MTEEWRAIPGQEGRYEVSDQGRVRSLRFRNRLVDIARREPLILRPNFGSTGYQHVALFIDYVCNGCNKPCGGDVGGPAFVVDRETPEGTEKAFAVLCAGCWNLAARAALDDDFCEPVVVAS